MPENNAILSATEQNISGMLAFAKGDKGDKGDSYVITSSDYQAIAEEVLDDPSIVQVKNDTVQLKSDVSDNAAATDNRINRFYTSNLLAKSVSDSDDGAIRNLKIYGKCEQGANPTPDAPQTVHSVVNPKMVVHNKNFVTLDVLPRSVSDIGGITYKNNDDGSITLIGTATGYSQATGNKELVLEKGTYTLSGNYAQLRKWSNKGITVANTGETFTLDEDTGVDVRLVVNTQNTPINERVIIQIEKGTSATSAEVHKEKSAKLSNITLNALPVSSGGNVTIDGQQYISDYVDIENKQVVRNVVKLHLDSSMNWTLTGGKQQCYLPNQDVAQYGITVNGALRCDKMIHASRDGATTIDNAPHMINMSTSYCIDSCAPYTSFAVQTPQTYAKSWTLDDFKTWLTSIGGVDVYAQTNGTTEPLTNAQVADFVSLRSYYGTTHATVSSDDINGAIEITYPCSMQNFVEYVKTQRGDTREFIYDICDAPVSYSNNDKCVYVTPEQFGAVGDGVKDDTQAMQKAMDYANEKKLSLVLSARYKISNTLKVKQCTITGDGGHSAIICSNDSVYAISIIAGGAFLHNFSIVANKGVVIGSWSNRVSAIFDKIGVKNCTIGFYHPTAGGYCKFLNCYVSAMKDGGKAVILGASAEDIGESRTVGTNYVYIIGCSFETEKRMQSSGTYGIYVNECQYLFVDKCDIVGMYRGLYVPADHICVSDLKVTQTTFFSCQKCVGIYSQNNNTIYNVTFDNCDFSMDVGLINASDSSHRMKDIAFTNCRYIHCNDVELTSPALHLEHCDIKDLDITSGQMNGSFLCVEHTDSNFFAYQTPFISVSVGAGETKTYNYGSNMSMLPIKAPTITDISGTRPNVSIVRSESDGIYAITFSGGSANYCATIT